MHFHERGRNRKLHLQRRFLRKRSAVGESFLQTFSGLNSLSQSLTALTAPSGREPLAWRESFRLKHKACGWERSPWGAVAQRLRGFKSAEPEKTVKRSSRRTGVNLQFFSGVALCFGVKRGEQPLFRGSSASKSLALFWFSFGVKREHPRLPPATPAEGIQNRPTQSKGRCTVRCSGLCFPHFYLAVLIKLRLSHRYLMPEMAVTAATSQHRAIETTTTMETLSTVPR